MNKHFETLAVVVLCTVFVLSMHQSCSGLSERLSKKQQKTEINKVQKLKNNTINTIFIRQR